MEVKEEQLETPIKTNVKDISINVDDHVFTVLHPTDGIHIYRIKVKKITETHITCEDNFEYLKIHCFKRNVNALSYIWEIMDNMENNDETYSLLKLEHKRNN